MNLKNKPFFFTDQKLQVSKCLKKKTLKKKNSFFKTTFKKNIFIHQDSNY